jgi:hypothetical protein
LPHCAVNQTIEFSLSGRQHIFCLWSLAKDDARVLPCVNAELRCRDSGRIAFCAFRNSLRSLDIVGNAFKLNEFKNMQGRVWKWRQAEMRLSEPSAALFDRGVRVCLS